MVPLAMGSMRLPPSGVEAANAKLPARLKTASGTSKRISATCRFRAPRSSVSRVSPAISSRAPSVTGCSTVSGFSAAMITRTPVNGTGGVRPSSTVKRKPSHTPGVRGIRIRSAPPDWRKITSFRAKVRHSSSAHASFDDNRFQKLPRRGDQIDGGDRIGRSGDRLDHGASS